MTRLGAAVLLGLGAIALALFTLSMLRIPWTRTSLVISVIPFLWGGALLVRRALATPVPGQSPAQGPPLHFIFDAITFAIVVVYAIFATWATPYEWDFFGIWGSKAHVFFDARGIDWALLHTVEKADYPLLLPLLFDAVAIMTGGWNDAVFGWIYVALCASVIAVARGMFADELRWPALATLAVAFPTLNLWVGLAEAGVMAFGCAGVLFIRRGSTTLGAVLLGLAAWSKNEGLALIAVTALALLVTTRSIRRVLELWPAAAVIAPWLIARSALKLSTDFMEGSMLGRVFARLGTMDEVVRAFKEAPPDQPWFWLAVFVTLVVFLREAIRRELFLLLVVTLQLGLMVGQALTTKWDFVAHVSLTMNRLPHQVAPLAAFLAVMLLLPRVRQLSVVGCRLSAPSGGCPTSLNQQPNQCETRETSQTTDN